MLPNSSINLRVEAEHRGPSICHLVNKFTGWVKKLRSKHSSKFRNIVSYALKMGVTCVFNSGHNTHLNWLVSIWANKLTTVCPKGLTHRKPWVEVCMVSSSTIGHQVAALFNHSFKSSNQRHFTRITDTIWHTSEISLVHINKYVHENYPVCINIFKWPINTREMYKYSHVKVGAEC